MFELNPLSRAGLLVTTVKTAVVVAGMSYIAASWLSSSKLDQSSLARLASNASVGAADPLTTGSVARQADVKLDPCGLRHRS